MTYLADKLFLLFFSYSFLGWIWESSYTSIKAMKFINRGFLYGPLIPIYGFSALVILILTFNFKDNIFLVYIVGLLSASVMEYFTGYMMEKIFHMRYWDYSKHKFNLNGHISLFVSIFWGFFSLLLVYVVNPFVSDFIKSIPNVFSEYIAIIISIAFAVDTTISVQSAFDMKKLLREISEKNKIYITIDQKVHQVLDNINYTSEDIQSEILQIKNYFSKNITEELSKIGDILSNEKSLDKKRGILFRISFKVEQSISYINDRIKNAKSNEELEQLYKILDSLESINITLFNFSKKRNEITQKEFKIAKSILKRNPGFLSFKFKKSLEEIREKLKNL
ncbi:MAG: putative ABC transporter permease [Peptoniphilaceae bacterium]|nr:putative ABC transporter permease [Peptoniphilaceae bacterium]